MERDRREDENGVVPLSEVDQLVDGVVTTEAHIDNQTRNVGYGVDGDVLVLTGTQTTEVYLQVVEEVW